MRAIPILCVVAGLAHPGCSPKAVEPGLTIVPAASGRIAITAPTVFSAVLTNLSGEVTWAVTGDGKLSGSTGLHVSYAPPLGTTVATLTASAGGITAAIEVTSGPRVLTDQMIPGLGAPVTVQYDAEDIPHIRCAAAADCLAAQGYLHARDRLFPMDFLRHVARSNLAELIGADGLAQDIQIRTLFITRAGHRLEDDLVAALDARTAAWLDAYVRGINAFLAALRAGTGAMPGEYAQLPFPIGPADIADWTAEDTLALARLQQFQLSESIEVEAANGQFAQVYGSRDPGKITAWIRAAAPATEQAHTLSATASRPSAPTVALAAMPRPRIDLTPWAGVLRATARDAAALRRALRPGDAPVGSNNWVVAATRSATGKAMVANDPHLGLPYPPLFYLSVMTSSDASDNLDLAGGSFPGIPGALVGRGAHVGWGVTVVGYDVTDLYLEQFLPPASCTAPEIPCVLFKGAPVSAIQVPQRYRARIGPGAAGVVDVTSTLPAGAQFVLMVPHHGPIIQAPDADGHSISVRWTGHEGNTRDLRAIFGLNTAADVDQAIAALRDFSTGAQNFALADDQGHIAYDPHALIPVRTFTETGAPIPPWYPIPGDGSAEWGDGAHACASAGPSPVDPACWLADDQLPHGKDPAKGYFFTANADPTARGVSDGNDPLASANLPYLSFNWADSTGFRATRIEQRLEDVAAARPISLADMEAIQADHVSRPGMAFAPIVAAFPATAGPAELALAQAVLAQWAASGFDCPTGLTGTDPGSSADPALTVAQSAAGCFLFHVFLRTLIDRVFADDLAFAGQDTNGLAATQSAIKALLYMLAPSTPDGDQAFCHDVDRTTGAVLATHTCTEQVALALVSAYQSLAAELGPPSAWRWGRVHTIRPASLFPLVTVGYQPGPYARPGGAFTIDIGDSVLSATDRRFAYAAGSNVRHISVMDPARPIVRMQLPGPERDVPTYGVGPDLLDQWVENQYFDFAFGSQIDSAVVATQAFKP